MFNLSLENKLAWITGSSRGIGRQVAISCAKAGADIVVSYNKSKDEATKVVSLIENEYQRKVLAVELLVQDSTSCQKAFQKIQDFFGTSPDILVNCAGITRDNLFLMIPEQDWKDVIEVNLMGYVNTTKLVLQDMAYKRWGRVINISSVAATKGGRGQSNYAASKGALEAMSRSLACEVAKQGIRVNCIAPGVVDTKMSQQVRSLATDEILKRQLVKRFATCEEIAAWVVMLCSEYGDFVTGTTIHIDGGLKMP